MADCVTKELFGDPADYAKPIKDIEVRCVCLSKYLCFNMHIAGKMETGSGIPENQGPCEATHRLVQLFHQRGNKKNSGSK